MSRRESRGSPDELKGVRIESGGSMDTGLHPIKHYIVTSGFNLEKY